MTLVLLFLMGYQFWQDAAHEWAGAGMFLLFIVHHILNISWYRSIFKGKYTPARILQLVIDLLVFLAMIGLMVSGIILSNHVFDFLNIRGGMGFARLLHMAASYWGFVLMALHLGLHWGIVLGTVRKAGGNQKPSALRTTILRALAAGISAYGAYAFIQHHIADYLFLRSRFVFFDYAQPPVLYVLDLLAMMGLWIALSYYLGRAPRSRAGRASGQGPAAD